MQVRIYKTAGETTMQEKIPGRLSRKAPLAIAMVISAVGTFQTIHANSSSSVVVVPPADLPALARESGEAMFLRDASDGRMLLYVEQRQGSQLAIFDVTDPAHVKGEGSAQLDAAGPFDFVGSLGERAELVRFRQGQGEAILDLRKAPTLKELQGLELQGSTMLLGDSGLGATTPADSVDSVQNPRDFQVLQSGKTHGEDSIIEVKQVRQEATNVDTGTTFLLAEKGLYVIRRPALESPPEVYLNTGG
jgi:hypothetical protein